MTIEITDTQIRKLETEAGEHGDLEQVEICRKALAGDSDARAECARVIEEAQAHSALYTSDTAQRSGPWARRSRD